MKKDQTQNESPRSSTPENKKQNSELRNSPLMKAQTAKIFDIVLDAYNEKSKNEKSEIDSSLEAIETAKKENAADYENILANSKFREFFNGVVNKQIELLHESWKEFVSFSFSDEMKAFLNTIGAPTTPVEDFEKPNTVLFDICYAGNMDVAKIKLSINSANKLFKADGTAAAKTLEELKEATTVIWPTASYADECTLRFGKDDADDDVILADDESKKRCEIFRAFFQNAIATTTQVKNTALKSHVMQNSAVTNYLQAHPVLGDKQGFDVPVIPARKKNEPITTFVQLQYTDEALQAVTPRKLTEQERAMNDAICSLIKAGQPVFDDTAVYTAMYGSGRPTPNFTDDLDRWIWEAAGIRVELDATDEMRKRGIAEAGEAWTKKQMFYSVQGLKRSKNGHLKNYYHFIEKPPLLAYCEANNQLATVPQEYLDVKAPAALAPADWKEAIENGTAPATLSPIKMSVQRSAMLYYMLRRIAAMKYEDERYRKAAATAERYNRPCLAKKPITRILFASIFEAAGVPDEANTARRKDKQFCEQCLLYWQSLHYIKGYTLVKKGRAVVAIDVHP